MFLARCTLIERATIFDGQIEEYEWVMVQIEHVEIINNWNVELKKKTWNIKYITWLNDHNEQFNLISITILWFASLLMNKPPLPYSFMNPTKSLALLHSSSFISLYSLHWVSENKRKHDNTKWRLHIKDKYKSINKCTEIWGKPQKSINFKTRQSQTLGMINERTDWKNCHIS